MLFGWLGGKGGELVALHFGERSKGEFNCTFLEFILPYLIWDLDLENNSLSKG